ncbi:DEAD/DEAH box helicase, partial [Chitinivibrio alkaliphilus]|uniref:DEAD/DEAH box helicase n=1 Tax=Chitinivibrio alkaliphilus TaxID=1505232 RepID=UPI0006986E23
MSKIIHHKKFGEGSLMMENGSTVVVRFSHGIEECPVSEVSIRKNIVSSLEDGDSVDSKKTLLKSLAASIRSVNDTWGVFSKSRIDLLPHQLWVCNRVLQQWPTRMLIAEDVGLGKTVEAGLILWPLISSGRVKRLLVLTPAPLVEQWQERLRKMFDIRLSKYDPAVDTEKSDFWNTQRQVVASFPTLRADKNGRHDRLLNADAWDLVVVDEAHHMFAHEGKGKTLAFQLFEKLQNEGKIDSTVLFTGTPHRGYNYGFWSLMSLVDNKVFGPKKNETAQYKQLSNFLIRNCKQSVTDMEGNKLFKKVIPQQITFSYSKEETHFYDLMTRFITSGKTYASTLDAQHRGQVTLVLIALQKLASSSVAAVQSALITRKQTLKNLSTEFQGKLNAFNETHFDDEEAEAIRKWAIESHKSKITLMEDEVGSVDQLINAAEAVQEESRVLRIIQVIEEQFHNEPVLFFTEYKKTQSLVLSKLATVYGEKNIGFINGDGKIDIIVDGQKRSLLRNREQSADDFNNGKIRFLVSTEAAGEGIDLQERCNSLIHIDLPWNPMRLHQRVGRLYRYGQQKNVTVISLKNPDTIESIIWDKLESKLGSIMKALGSAMDDPEDLLQLVLGMQSNSTFNELFHNAAENPKSLSNWFDEKTQSLGTQSVIETVNKLVGNAAKFNLSSLKDVPTLDLPQLHNFFVEMLTKEQRRVKEESGSISFVTPDHWIIHRGIRKRYQGLKFERSLDSIDDIAGIGHPIVDLAIDKALIFENNIAYINGATSYLLYKIYDKKTYDRGSVQQKIFAIEISNENSDFTIREDSDIVNMINNIICTHHSDEKKIVPPIDSTIIEKATTHIQDNLMSLKLSFSEPALELFSVLIGTKRKCL